MGQRNVLHAPDYQRRLADQRLQGVVTPFGSVLRRKGFNQAGRQPGPKAPRSTPHPSTTGPAFFRAYGSHKQMSFKRRTLTHTDTILAVSISKIKASEFLVKIKIAAETATHSVYLNY